MASSLLQHKMGPSCTNISHIGCVFVRNISQVLFKPAISPIGRLSPLSLVENEMMSNHSGFLHSQIRLMNRNARRPKRANHGKRPVSHARKREKQKSLKSRLYREKVFGFW